MELEALSKRFFVRALETEDVDIIYDLCSNNSDYLQKARKHGHFTGYKN